MIKATYLLAALVLTGCASVSEMRQSGPAKEYQTDKNAKSVSECILTGWQDNSSGMFNYGESFIQPYGDGYSVYSDGHNETADIQTVSGKTNIKFYHRGGLFDKRLNARTSVIDRCK